MVQGAPCSGPIGPSPINAASAARARDMARSPSSAAMALIFGSSAAIRPRIAVMTSTGEICLARIIGASLVAGRKPSSVAFIGSDRQLVFRRQHPQRLLPGVHAGGPVGALLAGRAE